MYSHWGWSFLLVSAQQQAPFSGGPGFHPPGMHGAIAVAGKYILIATIVVTSYLMNSRAERPPLFLQFGAIAFLFMFLTPGFGAQYLSWLIPWVVAAGRKSTILFYATSGAYLLAAYGCVALIFGCDSYLYLGVVCWASLLFVLFNYYQLAKRLAIAAA
jgi:hypothetical protein